ncbi:Rne/Rng family ribonuclease [Phenylobacterium sp.]|uniref:Rne/Rng family ribonuclease n=1 Tax=Phenylobacterium sp. TaxID=1871053 RepID=UPI0025EDB5AA|nr:Rne/Rng family ribonuclease [Phenylobacterium sp.]MCA6291058.1 Rne/Rng family ribonuclease [Phenylobacterium sp.]
MSKKMLIDAAHAEETRVAVIDGNRIEEFDFESQSHKQLRGNIYLAKVTRVEPSLQAAFIEYGGNRHGFLAFNEIHPDYYQIPVADREALMAEEAADEEEDEVEAPRERDVDEDGEDAAETLSGDGDDDVIEQELARRRRRLMRRYKIQEVIRRRQIMLVQVVKEERGNKGAALTTYLSLAGRYCVLMPNTARGGGISRKITSATDRKRLKSVVQGLDVPEGMGLIVRTAGAKRTKAEIKRDYDYLLRLWENIRETTLHSVAPSLIYEEEDLVKRTIRDLYDKDIDEVLVEGEAGFREAREFMRMLMPSQARKVQAYREPTPLFVKHRVEDHLAQIYSPVAPLKSGGYLVINQTEALVAIDVNSGRATRERNVEATALRTNLEAAEEAARQLRLRDLAGLVVIDFIDMDESKNNRAVEKKLKDALKEDRARIQVGRISTFGLMELSRQRRRSSLLEGTTHVCEHCGGTGRVRSVESSALGALRAVEMEALKGAGEIALRAPRAVALYILNEKRGHLARLHADQGVFVSVVIDETLPHAGYAIERTSDQARPADILAPRKTLEPYVPADEDLEVFEDEEDEEDEDAPIAQDDEDEEDEAPRGGARARDRDEEDDGREDRGDRRGRRRRRRGRRDGEPRAATPASAAEDSRDSHSDDDEDGQGGRRRRRGRRGGRRSRDEGRPQDAYAWTRPWVPYEDDPFIWFDPSQDSRRPAEAPAAPVEAAPPVAAPEEPSVDIWVELPEVETEKPRRGRRSRGRGRREDAVAADAPVAPADAPPSDAAAEPREAEPEPEAPAKPARARRSRARTAEPAGEAAPEPVTEPAVEPNPAGTQKAAEIVETAASEPSAPEPPVSREPDPAEITTPPPQPRKGWWRRG